MIIASETKHLLFDCCNCAHLKVRQPNFCHESCFRDGHEVISFFVCFSYETYVLLFFPQNVICSQRRWEEETAKEKLRITTRKSSARNTWKTNTSKHECKKFIFFLTVNLSWKVRTCLLPQMNNCNFFDEGNRNSINHNLVESDVMYRFLKVFVKFLSNRNPE